MRPVTHLLPIACIAMLATIAPPFAWAAGIQQQTVMPGPKRYVFEGRTIGEQEKQALEIYNSATADIYANRWAEADEKLNQALQLAPDLYQAHSNHAIVLSHLGKLTEAKAEADTAARLGPDKPEPMVACAAVDQELGKLDEAAAQYELFIHKFPNHALAAYVRPLIAHLKSEAQKEGAVNKAITPGTNSADYFDYATYDAVAKWTANKFPLKVFIPTDAAASLVTGYAPEFAVALRGALDDWSKASGGALRYQYVEDRADADIDCSWTSDPTKVQQPAEGGEARVVYDPIHGIRHVTVVLLTRRPESSLSNSANLMKEVCLHEIGHSLGLIGHSPNPEDVMFCSMPSDDRLRPLSARDANTLIRLYRPDVKLADKYHGGESQTDKFALNNAGIKLAATQEFRQAVDKFEAALKLDPNFEAAKRNLSACLNNVAIDAAHNGDYPDALHSLKRALELEGDQGEPQKHASILRNLAIIYDKMGKTADAAAARAAAAKLQ